MRNKQHACSKYSDMYPLTNSVSTIRQYKTTRLGHLSKDILFSLKKKKKRKKREERKQKQSSVLYRSVYIYIYTPTVQSALPGFLARVTRETRMGIDSPSDQRTLHDLLQDGHALTYLQEQTYYMLTSFRINRHWPSGSTCTDHLHYWHPLTYLQDQHVLRTDLFRVNRHWPIFRMNMLWPSWSTCQDLSSGSTSTVHRLLQNQHALTSFRLRRGKKKNTKKQGPTLPSGLLRSIVIIITMQLLLF